MKWLFFSIIAIFAWGVWGIFTKISLRNYIWQQTFIIISSVLLFLFYLGLHEGLKDGGSIIGPYLFITASILGILIAFFFPLDEGGEIITWRGKMHLILVIAMGMLTIAGMIALWFRLNMVSGCEYFCNLFTCFSNSCVDFTNYFRYLHWRKI